MQYSPNNPPPIGTKLKIKSGEQAAKLLGDVGFDDQSLQGLCIIVARTEVGLNSGYTAAVEHKCIVFDEEGDYYPLAVLEELEPGEDCLTIRQKRLMDGDYE